MLDLVRLVDTRKPFYVVKFCTKIEECRARSGFKAGVWTLLFFSASIYACIYSSELSQQHKLLQSFSIQRMLVNARKYAEYDEGIKNKSEIILIVLKNCVTKT
eukprot:TRINITY_DN10343_c0_g3_i4.p7 TRINITY_DN10343_c0_g3~~TRINITY_DN10343_c0_g3_i4.p7  ORF type:complete len:103 (-),score=4.05 TRINITY_DN10343_c0_g3_i4:976-1284(-)